MVFPIAGWGFRITVGVRILTEGKGVGPGLTNTFRMTSVSGADECAILTSIAALVLDRHLVRLPSLLPTSLGTHHLWI